MLIRFYLVMYAALVLVLWLLCPHVPDGLLHETYGYVRIALHIVAPTWIAKQSAKRTAQSILDHAEQGDTQIRLTGVASQHR